ncbi:protein vav-like isoform X3 [Homarus americanus]|uniref:protein vav-like isoform X3 n=1 Tax=Homarus americanus TaxID=6706 RepID=UPI001C495CDB|nr:protein vav-like isoform X3 [Homarus americanus]
MSSVEWRECPDWLARIGLISRDHVLTSPNATLIDFCRFLRDGVMVCKLLYILDEDSIDLRSINQRPQNARFLCMKNIGIFLQTCEKMFDLDKDDLFEPEMLFEFLDFGRVIATLSKLSKSQQAQYWQVKGFPEDRGEDKYDNKIYETLSTDMVNGPAGDLMNSNIRTFEEENDFAFKDEKIYADLKLCHTHPRQLLEEDDESMHIYDEPSNFKEDIPKEKRDLCLQELVETENNYVDALHMLCNKFHKPLKKLISEEQLQKVFCKIPELAKIHSTLHGGLKEAQNNSHNRTVSKVFLDNQENLLLYGDYCANLTTAQQELEDVMNNNETVKNVIQECQREVSDGRHQLREYLVVPLQRILKYHLLLQELVRHTQPNHADLHNLKKAYEAMMDLAEYINEVKRDKEMQQIINDLQMSIMDMPSEISNLEDLGKLRYDGETRIECHPDTTKKRYVFVFDKVVVICGRQTRRLSELFIGANSNRWSLGEVPIEDEKYVFKDWVKLENCKVEDTVGGAHGGSTKVKQNSFYLVVKGNKKAYTFLAKDSDAKQKWMKNISEAIEYLNPHVNQELGHEFAITTFTKPSTKCDMCVKLLKGCMFQGYQCARCRMVVHKSCMSNVNMCHGCVPQLPLQQQGHQPPSLYPGYGNLQVQEYPWWAERMSRDDATIHLGLSTNGTFLIRWSDRHEKLILSLKAMGEVKHMRILRQEEGGYFYLSEARYFKDIMELINFYRQSPLSESFTGLDCCLRRPLYDSAVVKFPYVGTGASHLSLVPGQKIVIMSREGENRGWWKGRSGNRMGYFPKEYVTLEHNSMHPW